MKLTEIIGLEEKHAKLLAKAGIKSVEDLLPLTRYQIQQLARKLGVTVHLLDSWQEHADLMRISEVTPEYANLLNKIGIDSVKEFAYRNPKNTLEKIKQFKKENPKIVGQITDSKNGRKLD